MTNDTTRTYSYRII